MKLKLPSSFAYVVLIAAVVMTASSFVLFARDYARAQLPGSDLSLWYGGRIIAYVPVIPNPVSPVPLCPAHMVINDVSGGVLSLKGIYFPGSGTFGYLYSTLLTGSNPYFIVPGLPVGAWTLGKNLPLPFVTCPTPYKVYPSDTNFSNYFLGTSLSP